MGAGTRYFADWTDDNVEKLRKMAADGYSARDIALEIPGATRSGVIGKARRIGIKLNGKHANQEPNPDSRRQKELARAPNAKGYHFCPYHNHIARPPREKKPGHPGRE